MVATPIGNMEDIGLRAIAVLRNVKLIAAEDTRKTRRLLSVHEIRTPMASYHEHNKRSRLPALLQSLTEGDLALVSEAGMPGINDPGYDLVRAAIENAHEVVPIPGPSAITTALAASGLNAEQFVHLGFLPRKRSQRQRMLSSLAEDQRTVVAFETPHRLTASLEDIRDTLGNRRMAICRELTKLHEEIFRGTPEEALHHFRKPRGEFTLVIEGKPRRKRAPEPEAASR